MLRCFVVTTPWMFLGVVLTPGRQAWRSGAARSGFLGQGSLTAPGYNLIVAFFVTMAATFFSLTSKTRQKP